MTRHWSRAPIGDETEARIEIDEITTEDGIWFQVDGYVMVSGEVDADGDVFSIQIDGIYLHNRETPFNAFDRDRYAKRIDDRHPLWKLITASISDERIEEALLEEADSNGTISHRSYAEQVA